MTKGGKLKPNQHGLIYFIQADGGENLIKIGFTGRGISARFCTLRATSPVPLRVLGVMDGTPACETKLHKRFFPLWSHGEWFRPAPELIAYVGASTRSWDAPAAKHRPVVSRLPKVMTLREWAENVVMTHLGVRRTVAEWADLRKVPIIRLKRRLEAGVDPGEMFFHLVFGTTPAYQGRCV